MKVPRIEVGMARSTFTVVDQEPRKSQHTSPVRTEARTRVNRISLIACSTKTVVSQFTSRLRPSGRLLRSSSVLALINRPTATALAPRSLVMPMLTAGCPMVRPRRRRSSRPSSTTATSFETDGRALLVGDDEVREGLDVDGLALGAHVHLALRGFDASGGHLEMLAGDGAVDVVDGQALRLHAHRVVPDPDRAVAVAVELHVAHARHGLELGLDHVADVVGDEGGRTVARQGQPDDGLVFGVVLGDDGRIDAAGQAPAGLGDLGLDVLERGVDVAVEVELDGDAGRALARGRGDLLHPLDRGHRVLDGVHDVRLHDLGRRPLVGHGDVDHREVDVGVLADAEALEDAAGAGEAEGPEADEGEHQDPGEDVVADRDVREGHPGGDLLDVFLFRLS